MRTSIIASFLAAAATVSALSITFPKTADEKLDLSKDNTITWTTVTSDPATVRVELVNNVVNPPVSIVIAEKVSTKDEKYTLKATAAKTGKGYQINFVGTEKDNNGIVAQSQQFTIEKAASTTAKATESAAENATPTSSGAAAPTKSDGAASNLQAWSGLGAVAVVAAVFL